MGMKVCSRVDDGKFKLVIVDGYPWVSRPQTNIYTHIPSFHMCKKVGNETLSWIHSHNAKIKVFIVGSQVLPDVFCLH